MSTGEIGCDSCAAYDDLHWSKRHDAWFCDGCYVRENSDLAEASSVAAAPCTVTW